MTTSRVALPILLLHVVLALGLPTTVSPAATEARPGVLASPSDLADPPDPGPPERPASPDPLSFGLITDVQYADKEPSGRRRYRESLEALALAVDHLNARSPAFLLHLGDIIDGNGDLSVDDLETVLQAFERFRSPVHHVLGNHCLEVARPVLLPRLGLAAPYYSFAAGAWRMVVLDTMDISLKSPLDSPEYRQAQRIQAAQPDLPTYNGAVGGLQMAWLRQTLEQARTRGQRVLVFSHHPLASLPERSSLMTWNAEEVRSVVEASGVVVACFSGHDHAGAYTALNGIHYLTLPGLVEASPGQTRCAVVSLFEDRIEVEGGGEVEDRVWPLPSR